MVIAKHLPASASIHKVKIYYDLKCPMQDGTELSTDVYMPREGGPFPVILWRTPYDKHEEQFVLRDAIYLAQRGYAVATQDVRGRYNSPGEWYPMIHEVQDGNDAIKWVARQPWSTGKVGAAGQSYHGLTQWQAAQGCSGHLIASVPRDAYSNAYHNWVFTGGALQLAFTLYWSVLMRGRTNQPHYPWFPEEIHLSSLCRHLPLITSDEAIGDTIHFWKDWINNPSYNDYWRSLRPVDEHYSEIEVASYSMAGWYDAFLQGGLNNFMGMTKASKTHKSRKHQKIIIGPWIHCQGDRGSLTKCGDIDFGPTALIDLREEEIRWFDYWLKDIDNGIINEPRVKVFVMGSNYWREAEEWPLPETRYTPYYFHSQGNANSLFGDGFLNNLISKKEPPDRYEYDPERPVMTIGGNACCSEIFTPVSMGPRDQRPNETRPDVLVYTTPPLDRDIEVTGPLKIVLYASSSARDTDFTAKLVDVFPDGYAMNVAQGIQRARYRESWERPSLLKPSKVYQFTIDLWSTSNCFMKGHQIRVEISSSNFPQFDRNPNTGNHFGYDTQFCNALQTVYHDKEHPSHILLPIIP